MSVDSLLSELYGRQTAHFKLSLGPMRSFAKKLGNPERTLRVVHVAGTNGKGSTCMMLFSILRKAGYRVGLYTSPHLKRFNERIKVDDTCITDKDIVCLYRKMKPHITTESFFEITTMMAFLYFAQRNCDIVIVEVGIGGRLDATNIVRPLVSVITSIGKEHTQYLGDTIEKIAWEKGGIIKLKVPVVDGTLGKASAVIRRIAKEHGSTLSVAKRVRSHNGSFAVGKFSDISFKHLAGKFQRRNAGIAVSTAEVLRGKGFAIPDEAVMEGLRDVRCPARFEFVQKDLVIDCAHNVPGLLVLEKELSRYKGKNVLVVTIMRDKSVRAMMKVIDRMADEVVVTLVHPERTSLPEDLAKLATKRVIVEKDPRKAVALARRKAGKNGRVVVAGSMYLVGMFAKAD